MMTSASWSRSSATTSFSWQLRHACGYLDEHGWTCGYTRAEYTHITGEEAAPP